MIFEPIPPSIGISVTEDGIERYKNKREKLEISGYPNLEEHSTG